MDEKFKILYVIKMLKKIFKDVIVLIWISVLLFITQDIKTFYLISFDNLMPLAITVNITTVDCILIVS